MPENRGPRPDPGEGVRQIVYYFVTGSDGARYGPADIDTLVAWTREGRIIESTLLIERGTDRPLRADEIPAILAVLRRPASSGPSSPVVIERPSTESPTMTQMPGDRAAHAHGHPVHALPPIPPVPPSTPPRSPALLGYAPMSNIGPKSRLAAGLLGIFLGGFGVHRFYLGYTGIGLLQIFVTAITCGAGSIWGLVEGIICLTGGMRDADGLELRD